MRGIFGFLVVAAFVAAVFAAPMWYIWGPVVYDFGNGAELKIPFGAFSADQREKGLGIFVESGVNVTVRNDSEQWRTLTVSYRRPNWSILDTHAFEDLAPKSSKTFGADPSRYEGAYVSVSDYAQKARDKD